MKEVIEVGQMSDDAAFAFETEATELTHQNVGALDLRLHVEQTRVLRNHFGHFGSVGDMAMYIVIC